MTNSEIVEMTKANLQRISVPEGDDYLLFLVKSAKEEIEQMGIHLTDNVSDSRLVVAYVTFLYDKRKSDNQTMPRHLQLALNNRLFSRKMGDYFD